MAFLSLEELTELGPTNQPATQIIVPMFFISGSHGFNPTPPSTTSTMAHNFNYFLNYSTPHPKIAEPSSTGVYILCFLLLLLFRQLTKLHIILTVEIQETSTTSTEKQVKNHLILNLSSRSSHKVRICCS